MNNYMYGHCAKITHGSLKVHNRFFNTQSDVVRDYNHGLSTIHVQAFHQDIQEIPKRTVMIYAASIYRLKISSPVM